MRGYEGEPVGDGLFVREAAEFLAVGKNCVKGGVGFGEVFDDGAHVGERLNGGEACDRGDVGIGRGFADAVPFFFVGILGRKEENFAGTVGGGIIFCGEDDEAGAFFVVTGEVVEIVFLRKNVSLQDFFAAGEAPEDDRGVNLSGEGGTASGVGGVGFAFAALLGGGKCRKNE